MKYKNNHYFLILHPGIKEWGIRVYPKLDLAISSLLSIFVHPVFRENVSIVSRQMSGFLLLPPTATTLFPILTTECPNLEFPFYIIYQIFLYETRPKAYRCGRRVGSESSILYLLSSILNTQYSILYPLTSILLNCNLQPITYRQQITAHILKVTPDRRTD